MSPKKVLHILHAFSHGGLENGIVNIINGSPPDIEHELCLLTTAGEFVSRLHKPVRYYELRKRRGNSLGTILQLRRIILHSRADIVHTRNWGAFDGVIAALFCPGVKLLHGEHGRDMADPLGLNRRRNLLRRLFSPRVRKFTTVSEDLAAWLSGKVGIRRDKILLIRNGVDTEQYHPHRDSGLRGELGIDEGDFVVGTLGRLDPVKNHAGLIKAFATLSKGIRAALLVIVGDGPEKANLENLIRTLGISPSPILTGYRSDVARFYGLFDVFVLNSFAEGMSNTLLEAMSSGLPVICTPVGANVELIKDPDRGRFVPVGDEARLAEALREFAHSPDLRTGTGLNAREYVEKFHSLSEMIRQYSELYLNI